MEEQSCKPKTGACKFLYAIVSLAIISGAVLLLLEGGVRLFLPQPQPPRWLKPDVRYGHVAKPGFHQHYQYPNSDFVMDVQTNSLGFRDDEVAPYSPGKKTVLFIGDSFTFGEGVQAPKRFDKRLADVCRKNAQTFRFINVGVDGWGTLQETRFAKDNFATLHPDIIVLTFCENDPFDDAYLLNNKVTYSRFSVPGKEFLREHSHVYRFLSRTLWLLKHDPDDGQGQALSGQVAAIKGIDTADAITVPPEYWEKTLACLREFHQAFLAFNPDGVLIIQPTSPTCADIRTHLRSLSNGKNLLFCDMFDDVSPLPLDERRLPFDPHWSLRMHEISAAALYKLITRALPQAAAEIIFPRPQGLGCSLRAARLEPLAQRVDA